LTSGGGGKKKIRYKKKRGISNCRKDLEFGAKGAPLVRKGTLDTSNYLRGGKNYSARKGNEKA